ncbi:MAG TPA: hypothetical protein VHE81_17125, partial [Lacipirellulaceae bacterium]|nr:hypothetical protein [Lacipirellulaceae bacterium]
MAKRTFDNLSAKEAQTVLSEFLEDGRANIDIVIAHANRAGVRCDYTIESLEPFLHWARSEMHTLAKNPDVSVPEFIRSTEDYQRGLFDFDDRSKNLLCFSAYYFGECFVRNFAQLRWAAGNIEYAEANMPVVTGFLHDHELAPVWVLNNIFRRIIKQPGRVNDIKFDFCTLGG